MFDPLLIAFAWTSPWAWVEAVVPWLEVALGIGLVIFFHELGHFAVAKACGVKCEKFYIGFDIGGRKLWKKQWGETEYGIGILPLGGYVKMLGQDDNPARQTEEAERAKAKSEAPADETAEGEAAPAGAAAARVYDPRSYMAKSVPQRMAIISAGVIMNLLFAVVAATWAYAIGVPYVPCVVSNEVPGGAAFENDVRPGDEFREFDGIKNPRFDDLRARVILANREQGIPADIIRPGEDKPFHMNLKPRLLPGQELPIIGIGLPVTMRLIPAEREPVESPKPPAVPGTPAAKAQPPFEGDDRIVAIDGEPINDYAQLEAYQVRHPDKTLTYTVVRGEHIDLWGFPIEMANGAEPPLKLKVDITVQPRPIRELGLVMETGPVASIRANSPAAEAGLKIGDQLLLIDGEPLGDPVTLPERLRRRAGETVRLTLKREAKSDAMEVPITLVDPGWPARAGSTGLQSIPALGLAFPVLNRVQRVEPGGPADKAGVKAGAVFTQATFEPAGEEQRKEEERKKLETKLAFEGEDPANWLRLLDRVQDSLPDTKVVLEMKDGNKFTLAPVDSTRWFEPDRGLALRVMLRIRRAESFGDAAQLALRETKESMLQVYWFIQRLSTRKLPVKSVGGPGTIFAVAADRASAGLPQFLLFLTMLNANLAVINFLPIPLLDGGHMVFLAIEGIRGKPVSERVLTPLLYIGLAIILGLMLLGITNDLRTFLHWLGFIGK